jgi:ribose transport system ATP-binding protein
MTAARTERAEARGAAPPLLAAHGVTKSFPGVLALNAVDFELLGGEVHALVGENGAGKSTLMKALGGVHQPDAGRIEFDGSPAELHGTLAAQRAGISVIHQEFFLMPHLTVAQNIFVGREPRVGARFWLNERELNARAAELLDRLRVSIDPRCLVGALTVAAQQMVEIAKALSFDARVLIMDEPTAALTDAEVETLFRLIREFVTPTTGVVYISHRMEEIARLADRITVMRDGEHIATRKASDVTIPEVIRLMVGRAVVSDIRPEPRARTAPVLEVARLCTPTLLKDVSFTLEKGEILGFAGLMGAGRTEVARAVVGADPVSSGRVVVNGREVTIRTPADAARHGIGYLSEDRKRYGLLLDHTVEANVSLASLGRLSSRAGFVRDRAVRSMAAKYSETLRIKTPTVKQLVRNLSGGNQQKVVLAKWLARDCDILIFDEPTRGIDVGVKEEIYRLLTELTEAGKSLIVISSEMEEVLRVCDRIVVMCDGRVAGTLTNAEATQERVMDLATHFTLTVGEGES